MGKSGATQCTIDTVNSKMLYSMTIGLTKLENTKNAPLDNIFFVNFSGILSVKYSMKCLVECVFESSDNFL